MVFLGVARKYDALPTTTGYAQYDSMAVRSFGRIASVITTAYNRYDDAYVIASGSDKGKFTNSASSNISVNCKFGNTVSGAGIGVVEVNKPYKPYSEITWS